MLALMGVQATIFSPSLNGSIPELYPAEYVTRANAVLKALVTGAILIGIALAGFVLSVPGPTLLGVSFGRLLVAVVVILLAALGLLTALGVPSRSAAAPDKPFPWTGPLDTLRELYETFKDPLLAFVIAMDVFIWFAGTVQVLLINQMGLVQLKLSEAWTSGLVIAELLGLAVGGLIISRVVSGERWYRILSPAAIVMSVPMMLIAALPSLSGPLRLVPFFVTIGLVGVAGGAILVPCESFIQTRPAPDKKGAVIAAANFAAFAGILLSGPAANALNARYDPTDSFLRLGLLSLAVGLAARLLLRRGRLR
jgi:acyl-[acyl-carrier-protein]-phospholipid O-acyltransferase/long-chain-fatty-acid--[acyl-carrier-protein] ligase